MSPVIDPAESTTPGVEIVVDMMEMVVVAIVVVSAARNLCAAGTIATADCVMVTLAPERGTQKPQSEVDCKVTVVPGPIKILNGVTTLLAVVMIAPPEVIVTVLAASPGFT